LTLWPPTTAAMHRKLLMEQDVTFDFPTVLGEPERYVVLRFTAPWCIICKRTDPAMDGLSKALGFIAFRDVNVEFPESERLAEDLLVDILPTFVLLRGQAGAEGAVEVGELPAALQADSDDDEPARQQPVAAARPAPAPPRQQPRVSTNPFAALDSDSDEVPNVPPPEAREPPRMLQKTVRELPAPRPGSVRASEIGRCDGVPHKNPGSRLSKMLKHYVPEAKWRRCR